MSTYRRSSCHVMAGSNNLRNEMRSWSRNKMEDRKLALRHSMVDRHMLSRRKSHQYEKHLLNKDIEENVKKTSVSTEEYLHRSHKRYNGWRAREQDRLDRRYQSLYKSYLKEYSQLPLTHLDMDLLQKELGIHPNNNYPPANHSEGEHHESGEFPDQQSGDSNFSIRHSLAGLSLEPTNKNTPDAIPVLPKNMYKRRASTGSILSFSGFKLPKSTPTSLSILEDVTSSTPLLPEGDEGTQQTVSDTPQTVEPLALYEKLKGSKQATDDSTETEIMQITENNNSNYDNKTCNDNSRTRRRSIIKKCVPVSMSGSPAIHVGKRLDRRPTLPNITIPLYYGN